MMSHTRTFLLTRQSSKNLFLRPENQQFIINRAATVPIIRKRKERRDSVTESIVQEREAFLERLAQVPVDWKLTKALKNLGLGSKRRLKAEQWSLVAAQGNGKHLASANKNWPTFKHMLPEIAFAGHSNCGKSTLVNALVGANAGKTARGGLARVSDRAGWTDQICFYQLGKKPPVFTLVDMPGYGYAVASDTMKRRWIDMIRDYIKRRRILHRCCVLVDCTRGLCEEDHWMLDYLGEQNVESQVILTKADLLDAEVLSQCIQVVQADLMESKGKDIPVTAVCARTGAGVHQMWKELNKSCAHYLT